MEDVSSTEDVTTMDDVNNHDINLEIKKKKKKHKSDKDRKKKKSDKTREKGFYNLDEYEKTKKRKKRKRKSVSPVEKRGLGYYETANSKPSSSSDHHDIIRHSDSHRPSRNRQAHSRARSHSRSRSRSRSTHRRSKEKRRRSRSRSQSVFERVDKEKLLQIAKDNLVRMVKAGNLPKGVDIDKLNLEQLRNLKEKNSISQWSEYCRALSVMEAATHDDDSLSASFSDSDDEDNSDTKSVCSSIVRHPFKLKEKRDIQIKVRDFAQLPTRSSKEIQKELTEKFPVSSGDTHRIKELEWVEVKPEMPPPSKVPEQSKKAEKRVFKETKEHVENETIDQPDTSVSSSTSEQDTSPTSNSSEIGTLVALRLSAKKKLQEDPLNIVAIKQVYEAERLITLKMQEQAMQAEQTAAITAEIHAAQMREKQFARGVIEQFSEGNRIKDGIGMHLLLKMGWQPGTGLGKNQTGKVEPIIPSLKFDTKGLVAEEEIVSKIPAQVVDLTISNGRNPISLLQEHCSKQKWDLPVYDMVEAVGPDHKKSFIMKCIVNGVEYRPSVSCGTKKQAKALAATVALQAYGLVAKE